MAEWFTRCAPCGADVRNGEMAEHLRTCEKAKDREPRTPFHGKPNEPITFADHEVPKV